jgi:hypothetical protein
VLRKYLTPFLLATVICWGAILFAWYARYTVASGEKQDDFAGVTYGYCIEQYYVRNSMRLTIWEKRGVGYGMKSVYDLPALTVDKVAEQRWLKNDAAIYLNLQIKYHDSLVSVHPARVIYDFHRGEMHTSSSFTLWRVWNEKNTSEGWMNDAEFDAVLSRLSK